MAFSKYLARYLAFYALFLIFILGPIKQSYAQPLFPQWRAEAGTNIAGPSNDTAQAQTGENITTHIVRSNITTLLASAEMQLNNAIRALQNGDTNRFNNSLTISQQQFTLGVENSPEPSSEEKIAIGGLYLIQAIRAVQGGDLNAINDNLNGALQEFAQVGVISPWIQTGSFSMESSPPMVRSEETEEAEGAQKNQTRQYTANELLARAGAHLAHAIGALVQGDTSNLDMNLIISQQQIQYQLPKAE